MKLVFIRHGEPDYSFINKEDNCQWSNLAPLTYTGKVQARELKDKNIRTLDKIIICSPYTRAFETAMLFANGKTVYVEPKLHEWLPSKSFSIKIKDIPLAHKEYKEGGNKIDYETDEEMIERMNFVINKYKNAQNLIIIAHARLICTYLKSIGIEKNNLDYCEVVEVEI